VRARRAVPNARFQVNLIKRPKHLHWLDARLLSEAPDGADFEVCESGFPFLDPNLKWRASETGGHRGRLWLRQINAGALLATRFIAVHGKKLGWTAAL